jgi:hypothetical protein
MVPPASVLQWGGIAAADWVATWHAQSGNISAAEFGLSPNEFVTGDADTSWDFESTPWQAMLSDSTTDAIDRLNIVGPVYNMNSQLVATSKADLFDGTLTAPIRFNELGNSISNNFQVWTGTNADGSWSGASAGAWNNPSEAASATVGDATKISPAWTTSTTIPASGLARLYALSPVFTVPLAGDFNDNGVVDLADYTVWRDNLGAVNENALNGNGSFSGGVDQSDYQLWVQNFGLSLNGVASSTLHTSQVPEPTGLWLLLAAGISIGMATRTAPAWLSEVTEQRLRGPEVP